MNWNIFKKKDIIPIETKAINQSGGIVSSVTASIPAKTIISNNPISLVRCNTGWVYSCNQKIANYISSVPIHLYVKVPKGKSIEGKNIKKIKNQKAIIKALNIVVDVEIVEVTDHDIIKLLQNPYLDYTWQDFVTVVSSYLNLIGNCYVWIKKDSSGRIEALQPLYSEYVYLNANKDGEVESYQYNPPLQIPEGKNIFLPDEIIHFRTRQAGSLVGGLGKAEAAVKAIALYNQFNDYEMQLSNNSAIPGLILISKTTNSDQQKFDDSANRLRSQFGDLRKGSPMVLRGDISVEQVGTPIKDLNYQQGRRWMLMEIAGAFGIPVDLLNPEDSNRSTSQQAMNSFLNHTIIPDLEKILEQINTNIVETYDENMYIWFNTNEVLQEDASVKATTLKTYVDSGIMTIDEAREQLGLPELEDDNEEPKEVEDPKEDIGDVNNEG